MELKVQALETGKSSKFKVSDAVFAQDYNEALIHQVITAYLAAARAGTHAQKTRAEVQGGGRKPWKQKGTGRARAGTTRSPLWRSGGVTFASKPRDYSQKVNKKMYRAAMRSILSELVRQERLIVVDSLSMPQPKTKHLLDILGKIGCPDALLISESVDENLYRSANNIPTVSVRDVVSIDPVSLLDYEKIVVTQPAILQIEEWLG